MNVAVIPVLVFALCSAPSFVQSAGNPLALVPTNPLAVKDKYHAIQIDLFEVKSGVEFPPEYLANLQSELSQQFASAKLFQEVVVAGQHSATADAPMLRLSGTIHHYKQGNRKERYLSGFAGAAEIGAQIVFVDGATGQKLVIEELRGVLSGGFFGGNEAKATEELARQIVTRAKLMLERRVPAPGEAVPDAPGNANSSSSPEDRQVLAITAKDWNESQRKLDEQAAAGYRVGGFSLTGPFTADLELEKTTQPPQIYQYKLIHVRVPGHLQGDIDKGTAEGFQIASHTLNMLGPFAMVILEKPPDPRATRYQYRVSAPMLMSSAQKDIRKYQGEGYTVLDESQFGSIHVLLFQKAIEQK